MDTVFTLEIVIIFFTAFIGGYIALKFRQNIIIGFLVSGIILAIPVFSGFIKTNISTNLASLGVALLLFATGLEFPISKLKKVKKSILLGVPIQMVLFIIFSVLFLQFFGFSKLEGLIISAGFSNSSTLILLNIFEKKTGDNNSNVEDIVSWLIVQDIVMVSISIIVSSIAQNGEINFSPILLGLLKSLVLISLAIILGHSIIPKLFEKVARKNSFELLLILSFVFCLGMAYLAEVFGVSYSLGAFLAGVMISESFVNHEIFSEIKPIKNIFLTIFFVSLGSLILYSFLWDNLFKIIGIFLAISILKILITFIIIIVFEKHTYRAFNFSLALFQSGEFAFILAQIGLVNEWISNEVYSYIIAVTILSFLLTPFIYNKSNDWYNGIRDFLRSKNMKLYRLLFIKWDKAINIDQPGISRHVIICGFGRVGNYIGRALKKSGIDFIVIDTDPEIIDFCKQRGISIVYGDASNIDVLEKADVERATSIIIALPQNSAAEIIASNARSLNSNIKIIARSHVPDERENLIKRGVNLTIEPEFEAAVAISKKLYKIYGKSIHDIIEKIKSSNINRPVAPKFTKKIISY